MNMDMNMNFHSQKILNTRQFSLILSAIIVLYAFVTILEKYFFLYSASKKFI